MLPANFQLAPSFPAIPLKVRMEASCQWGVKLRDAELDSVRSPLVRPNNPHTFIESWGNGVRDFLCAPSLIIRECGEAEQDEGQDVTHKVLH